MTTGVNNTPSPYESVDNVSSTTPSLTALSASSSFAADVQQASSTPSSLTALSVTPSFAGDVQQPLYLPWDAEDLDLFFHYLNKLCANLGDNDAGLWRDRVPRLAFRRHGVLHLILAASALHLAREEPSRHKYLEERAEMHFAIGLRQTTRLLPNLGPGNCAELYVATILVIVCSFAKKPGPQHMFLVTDGVEVAWWELFKGVRIIVETIGMATVFAGELAPSTSSQRQDDGQSEGNARGQLEFSHHLEVTDAVDWEAALGRLSALLTSRSDDGVRDTYQSSLNVMTWCFQETFGTLEKPKCIIEAKLNGVMAWLYCVDDRFISCVKEKEPVSLILLAHFMVLLQTLSVVWLYQGWPEHVLRGVTEILGSAWDEMLEWPTRMVEKLSQGV